MPGVVLMGQALVVGASAKKSDISNEKESQTPSS